MKYSKTTLMELSHKYSSILRKCALLNATILVTGALLATGAEATTYTSDTDLSVSDLNPNSILYASATNGGAAVTLTSTDSDISMNVSDNYAVRAGKASSVTITALNNNVNIHGKYAALMSNNTTVNTTSTPVGTINITADNIVLSADNAGGYGVVTAMSDGVINLVGNTTIKANSSANNDAILARGKAKVLINKAGDKVVKMDGYMDYNYNAPTSGTDVDALVDVTLAGADSYWNGNVVVTYDKGAPKPSDAKLTVTDSHLTIKDGATWNASKVTDVENGGNSGGLYYHALNYLTVDNGTINIADTSRGITVDNSVIKDATITGGPFNVANSLDVSGTLDISEGSITGETGAAITFSGATTLSAKLKSSAAAITADNISGLSNVTVANLVVENGLSDGSYALMSTGDAKLNITATNALYTFAQGGNGEITISKKSSAEVANELAKEGVSAQEAATISALASSTSGNPVLAAISEAVQTGNAAGAAQAAEELAPTTSQQVMGIAQSVNTLLNNVTGTRMAALGKAGGDAFIGGSTWVQGLYNHSKQDASGNNAGFSANTKGIAFGIDGKVNEAVTIGLGYGYTDTSAKSSGRKVDVDGHNFFIYGQYQPDAWYVNTMLSYGLNKYTEKKSPMGIAMKAKYDVNTFAANVMTGYDFDNGITPEGGLRYVLADQESYNDGAQRVSTDKNDVLTAVMGVKYSTNVKAEDWTFKPTLRLAATYDVVSDNSKANVNVTGGSNYQITGDRLHRFGVETGVGVTSSVKDWDLTLEYNGGFRKDFQSHTGMLKAKYNF